MLFTTFSITTIATANKAGTAIKGGNWACASLGNELMTN
jgi:hypothetical protein